MSLLISKGLTLFDFSDTIRNSFTVDFRCLGFYYHCFVFDFIPAAKGASLQYPSVMQMKLQGLFRGTVTWKILLTNAFAFESSKKKKTIANTQVFALFSYILNQCLHYYCDGQTNKGMNGVQSMLPPKYTYTHTHTQFDYGEGIHHTTLAHFLLFFLYICRTEYRIWKRRGLNKQIYQMLSFCFMYCTKIFLQFCVGFVLVSPKEA